MKEQPKPIFNDDHVLETVFRQILSYLYRTKIGICKLDRAILTSGKVC